MKIVQYNNKTVLEISYCKIEIDLINEKARILSEHYYTEFKSSSIKEPIRYINSGNLYKVKVNSKNELYDNNFRVKVVNGTKCVLICFPLNMIYLLFNEDLNVSTYYLFNEESILIEEGSESVG